MMTQVKRQVEMQVNRLRIVTVAVMIVQHTTILRKLKINLLINLIMEVPSVMNLPNMKATTTQTTIIKMKRRIMFTRRLQWNAIIWLQKFSGWILIVSLSIQVVQQINLFLLLLDSFF